MSMSVKLQLSNSYHAKIKRIKRLPKMMEGYLQSTTKKDASQMVKNFHDGIKQNTFRLEKLKDGTIQRKRGQGLIKPGVPLYGKGDDKKTNSYINALRIKKLKNGYKVYVSSGKHWSGVPLRMLFSVHEYGAVFSNQNGIIRIPPRPAFQKAFNRLLRQKSSLETAPEVKKIMLAIINSNNENILKQKTKNNLAFAEKNAIEE